MPINLHNKNILLGVSAGIAAYKTPDLVRKLTAAGAVVQVVLSKNADQFVAPLSLQAVSGSKVQNWAMTAESESGMGHIDLARWADAILIAPATANLIARLRVGAADELLTTLALATASPIAIAPAMNQQMWRNQATQANINALQQRDVHVLGPASGDQACGEIGPGRMLEADEITQRLSAIFSTQTLAGTKVMITAGPTWEALDPVRGLTNHSSGLMGYALAQAAIEAGAAVTLISGPTNLQAPDHCTFVDVESALEMHKAVMNKIDDQEIFIGVAAVADYRPKDVATSKIKKNDDQMQLELVKNPDILQEVAAGKKPPFSVGFAAETDDVINNARVKLVRKKLHLIAANHVGGEETGFSKPENAITLISPSGVIDLPKQNKHALARSLISEIAQAYQQQQ